MLKVYVRTDFTVTPDVDSVWTDAREAMLDFNRKYFGADFGTAFDVLEGWESRGQDVWVFSDEGDEVFIVGKEVK